MRNRRGAMPGAVRVEGTRDSGSRTARRPRKQRRRARTCPVRTETGAHAASEPGADDVEALERRDVAFPGRLGDHGARDHFRLATGEPEHVSRQCGCGLGEFLGLEDQRVPARVLLPAPLEAAPAPPPVGNDIDVPDLRGDPKPATQQPPIVHDSSAEPSADGENHHMVLAASGTEPRLRPGGGVRVVLDHHREPAAALDPGAQRLIPPCQVRGEEHGTVSVHETADPTRSLDVGRGIKSRPRRR